MAKISLYIRTSKKAGKVNVRFRLTDGRSDRRLILKRALIYGATSILLYHNHPSGNPEPSSCDIRETETLFEACKLMDIKLVDHIILGDSGYFSFSEAKASSAK